MCYMPFGKGLLTLNHASYINTKNVLMSATKHSSNGFAVFLGVKIVFIVVTTCRSSTPTTCIREGEVRQRSSTFKNEKKCTMG